MEKVKYNDPIINGVQYKTCLQCKIDKLATTENFRYSPRGIFNLRRTCKKCLYIRQVDYINKNLDKVFTYKKVYRKTLEGKFSAYKSGAKKRSIEFNLTFEQFCYFSNLKCFYCNRETNVIGVDRIETLKPYENENCVSCCEQCNKAKMDYTMLEFFNMCKLVVNTHNL